MTGYTNRIAGALFVRTLTYLIRVAGNEIGELVTDKGMEDSGRDSEYFRSHPSERRNYL